MKKAITYTLVLMILMVRSISAGAQYQYMGAYDFEGWPYYLVNPGDTISATFLNDLQATLPEGRSVPVYNPQLISSGRPETISLSCASDVWVTFIGKGASFQNSLGYYTYPTDSPLTAAPSPSQITIIFPNASPSGYGGGLNAGDKVYLGHFPANTSIGFALMANGWDYSTGLVTPGKWTFFSDSRFNPEADSLLRRHTLMIFDTTSHRIITGFEDTDRDSDYTSDMDFNDLLIYTTITNYACINSLDSIPVLTSDGHIAFSGSTGGLESKSLGSAVANRIYHKALNSQLGTINYGVLAPINAAKALKPRTYGMAAGASPLTLSTLMPTNIPDSGYVGYNSTPTDITSITNAADVNSVDFVYNNTCRAVAFATETLGQMYDHTKAVCDRLKGAQLLGMSNFTLNNLNFVRYTLLQPDSSIQYAMSFSIGKQAGASSFSFQSNWLNADYTAQDTMYNFQLWGAAPYYCIDMALEILSNLNAIMPVQQLKASASLPNTYIISGYRNGSNMYLSVKNNTAFTSGYFLVQDVKNENTTTTTSREVNINVTANGYSLVTIPVNEDYQSTVSLYINNKLQDVVFVADGAWAYDSSATNASQQVFTVTNDTIEVTNTNTEYHLLRNVQISAVTAQFVSVYKLMNGGGTAQNLKGFNTMRFTASGSGTNLRIYLIKNSIANYASQYYYVLPLTGSNKDYTIALSDFKSDSIKSSIDMSDVIQVVFAFEVANGVSMTVNGSVGNVLFSTETAAYYTSDDAGDVQVYPNPSNGNFTASLITDSPTPLTMRVIDAATGNVVMVQNINSLQGTNNIPVSITQHGTRMYIVSFQASDKKFKAEKVLVNNN